MQIYRYSGWQNSIPAFLFQRRLLPAHSVSDSHCDSLRHVALHGMWLAGDTLQGCTVFWDTVPLAVVPLAVMCHWLLCIQPNQTGIFVSMCHVVGCFSLLLKNFIFEVCFYLSVSIFTFQLALLCVWSSGEEGNSEWEFNLCYHVGWNSSDYFHKVRLTNLSRKQRVRPPHCRLHNRVIEVLRPSKEGGVPSVISQ